MSATRVAAAVAGKDLRIEVRGRHATSVVVPFVATVLVGFGLALGPDPGLLRTVAPGLLWLAVLFASVLAFRRAYDVEGDDGAMEEILLAPVDRGAVYLGKAAAVAVQLLALEVLAVALAGLLLGLPLRGSGAVALGAGLVLGTVGLSALGSLFGVLAESPRAREAVFPLLVLPLSVPVLVAAVQVTTLATTGGPAAAGSWLGLLLAFDAVFVAAGTLVYGHLLED